MRPLASARRRIIVRGQEVGPRAGAGAGPTAGSRKLGPRQPPSRAEPCAGPAVGGKTMITPLNGDGHLDPDSATRYEDAELATWLVDILEVDETDHVPVSAIPLTHRGQIVSVLIRDCEAGTLQFAPMSQPLEVPHHLIPAIGRLADQ